MFGCVLRLLWQWVWCVVVFWGGCDGDCDVWMYFEVAMTVIVMFGCVLRLLWQWVSCVDVFWGCCDSECDVWMCFEVAVTVSVMCGCVEVAVTVSVMCGCIFQMFLPGLCGDTTYYSTKVFVSFVSENLKYQKENNVWNQTLTWEVLFYQYSVETVRFTVTSWRPVLISKLYCADSFIYANCRLCQF